MNKKILKKDLVSCILSFCISFIVCMIFFLLKNVYPFGAKVVDNPDFIQQRVPAFYHVWDAFHGKADIFFDWDYALGTSFFGTCTHFSILSPFSLFFLFCRRDMLQQAMTYYIALRLSCMGLSMCIFLRKDRLLIARKLPAAFSVIASVGYALSGYSLLYYGFSWIDVAVFFPLLILMLNEVILHCFEANGSFVPYDAGYVIILSLIIIMNIPQAFAVCLFLLFYAGGYLWIIHVDRADAGRIAFRFGILSVLAAGLAGVVFLPAAHELSQSYRFSISGNSGLSGYINTLNDRGSEAFKKYFMLKSLFIPLLLELICLIFRFIKNKIQRVDLFVVFINLIMILQVFFETVNHVWHNGDYVLFPMRHGYIMIFAVISGSAIMLSLVPGDTAPEALASSGLLKLCNAFVFLAWGALIFTFGRDQITIAGENDAVILSREMPGLYSHSDNKLERLKNADASLDNNYSLMLGLPAFGNYIPLSTFEQISLDDALGYSQDWVRMSDAGGTLFSDTLLQMNTLLYKNGSFSDRLVHSSEWLYEPLADAHGYSLCRRNTTYPYALFIESPEDHSLDFELDQNVFVNQNILSGLLFDESLFTYTEKKVTLAANASETFPLDVEGRKAVYIYTEDLTDISISADGVSLMEKYPHFLYNGLVPLGICDSGSLALTLSNDHNEETSGTLYIGMMDMDKYLATVREANENSILTPDSLSTENHTMDLTINAEKDGYVFVPVYAEDGWSIFVNGQRTFPADFFHVFYLIPVKEGMNSIHFSYFPRKLKAGLLITVLSFIAFTILHIALKKEKDVRVFERCFQIVYPLSCYGLLAAFSVAMIITYIIPVLYQLIVW